MYIYLFQIGNVQIKSEEKVVQFVQIAFRGQLWCSSNMKKVEGIKKTWGGLVATLVTEKGF